jgi:hypothetical protein
MHISPLQGCTLTPTGFAGTAQGLFAGRKTAVTGKEDPAGTRTFSAGILPFAANSVSKKEFPFFLLIHYLSCIFAG